MNIIKKLTLVITAIASTISTTIFTAMPKAVTQSYAANAAVLTVNSAAQLKAMKMCNTNFTDKNKTAKPEYRSLVFEAATALGHPHPELIMLENSTEYCAASGACSINGTEGRGIFINQDRLDKETYASRRMTIYHETAHLAKKHRTKIINHINETQNVLKTAQRLNEPFTVKACGQAYCTENHAKLMEKIQ